MGSLAVVAVVVATVAMAIGTARGSVSSVVSRAQFDRMLLHRNDAACQAKGFYTYDAFVAAASAFPGFGATGSARDKYRPTADTGTGGAMYNAGGATAPSFD